ncbi:RhaT family transporter [Rhodobacter xanthinilyticus]|uniref:RhaT family transporter n=1 Tax=Rhodobacter xanthinilyticus TaxID=1850250 RepID=A0A1D9M906_9RHOB|nr:DMT family transporter [Rhodobacter xanthinilyticus]AOZ68345.1 RhaT family transporter [Rhodobacter xanthinilyticus]
MTAQNTRAGIVMMIAATFIFAMQDGISRHLAGAYNTYMVVMVRYWFFAAFVIAVAARRPGGLRAMARVAHPGWQALRAVLLVVEIYVMIAAFIRLGLIDTHAVFISYPLLIAALSGPILGEKVGWRRWAAIGAGFLGILVVLEPGGGMFTPAALIPLAAASMFAVYSLATRYVSRRDSGEVSFFWTGVLGAAFATAVGLWFWQPMSAGDWGWMALLCVTAVVAHGLLIRAYEVAEASALQPFAYLQLVWGAGIGMSVFGDVLRPNVALGAAIVVGAGLFTLWRARRAGA